MTRKKADPAYTIDIHGNIKYPEPPVKPRKQAIREVSIDDMLQKGLQTIHFILRTCMDDANPGPAPRESVMNLKDCMSMLKDLKAQEEALLDTMSDEQVEEYLRSKK